MFGKQTRKGSRLYIIIILQKVSLYRTGCEDNGGKQIYKISQVLEWLITVVAVAAVPN